jgi:iron complex transport system ATP-binding protein
VILEINNLTLIRNRNTLIENFSCTFKKASIVLLTGGNGSGKSTLLSAIAGYFPYSLGSNSASILISGREVDQLKDGERAKLLSYLPQDPIFTLAFTVREILTEVSILNRSSSKMRSLKQLAKELDLLHLLDKSVLELSGGERQRVSIAIALSRESLLCLMDEPLSAQDEEHQVMIGRYIAKLSASGFLFLIATHDTSPFDPSEKAVISL